MTPDYYTRRSAAVRHIKQAAAWFNGEPSIDDAELGKALLAVFNEHVPREQPEKESER